MKAAILKHRKLDTAHQDLPGYSEWDRSPATGWLAIKLTAAGTMADLIAALSQFYPLLVEAQLLYRFLVAAL